MQQGLISLLLLHANSVVSAKVWIDAVCFIKKSNGIVLWRFRLEALDAIVA